MGIEELKKLIETKNRIVFFGGAGVSTQSGIPDFRSVDGLYSQQYKYPPETILSHTFFMEHTAEFYEFYRNKMLSPKAEPNEAHLSLTKLENAGKLRCVITQNIDGLHQKAGTKKVLELHGSVYRNKCTKCGRDYGIDTILKAGSIPKCDCGGIIKPEVVLYEEALDEDVMREAVYEIRNADLLIVGGTSLSVYPAAGLIEYRGVNTTLALINKTPTAYDDEADIAIYDSIGKVLGKACMDI